MWRFIVCLVAFSCLYASRARPDEALIKQCYSQEAKQLLQTARKNKSAINSYKAGLIYYGRAKLQHAADLLTRAIEQDFPGWRARFYRAKVFLLVGDKTAAAKDLAYIAYHYPHIDLTSLLDK